MMDYLAEVLYDFAIDLALLLAAGALAILLVWKYTAALILRMHPMYLVVPMAVLLAIFWIR